jgi:drug/metabolite transporter (DMT)-like permease
MSSHLLAVFPVPLLLPLLAGMVYVIAALFLKRAAESGANVWRTAHVCNMTITLMFMPLVLLGGTIPSWQLCWQPAVVGLLFMAGQIFTLLSLNKGDVSVATPVLGMKILVVALLSAAFIREGIGTNLWLAAILSTAAIALLNFSRVQPHQRIGSTIFLAALAATAYALMDVLVQKWSPAWGAGRFLPLAMGFVGVSSLALHPLLRSRRMLDQTTLFGPAVGLPMVQSALRFRG